MTFANSHAREKIKRNLVILLLPFFLKKKKKLSLARCLTVVANELVRFLEELFLPRGLRGAGEPSHHHHHEPRPPSPPLHPPRPKEPLRPPDGVLLLLPPHGLSPAGGMREPLTSEASGAKVLLRISRQLGCWSEGRGRSLLGPLRKNANLRQMARSTSRQQRKCREKHATPPVAF